MKAFPLKLNTSNPGKLKEFQGLFEKHGCLLEASHCDLKEIDADPVSVVSHKASQLAENVMVEDTSLEIEGASIGIHVRWLLDSLPDYIGHQAEWVVLLAVRKEDLIHIYKGSVLGTIVDSRGAGGFGFDPVFLPHGETKTLAESKPHHCNARALAVEALLQENIWKTHPIIKNWNGPWQSTGGVA